ncbi:MAG TPA: hypothetical protein DCP38_15200 [Acidobacteria bacterium]|nr:hypothetical protein [Acidobacteriota bacterium]
MGSVMQLMDAMTIPASNAVFNVGRQPPETDEEWSALALSAVVLAESGNLLLIRDRARDEAAWTEASQAMVEAGAAALGAVEARDVDALLDAGDVVFGSCEACHATYLKRE